MVETCPNCGRDSLRRTNVMGSTKTIYYACGKCCYKKTRHYEGDTIFPSTHRQLTLNQSRLEV